MAFPDEVDRDLIRKAERVNLLGEELSEWVADFNDARKNAGLSPISENDELELLNLRRKAGSLFRSANVPVAVAVYGASQQGKSLFVGRVITPVESGQSPLGRDPKHGPPAYIPELSFDADLNPRSGEVEATALVTRFTTKDRFDKSSSAPAQFPVIVRALSRAEWIRVLALGFLTECDVPNDFRWEEKGLERVLSELSSEYPAERADRSWRMDLIDVWQFVQTFQGLRYLAPLTAFNGLLSRYPLSEEGYVALAGRLFWYSEKWPDLTKFFTRVYAFLKRLNEPDADGRTHEGLLCHWGAVRFLLDSQLKQEQRNVESKVFKQLNWSDFVLRQEQGWWALDYQPGAGPPSVPLDVIQAAMLELVVPLLPERLHSDWAQVIDKIDVLDIPGMRATRGETAGGKIEKAADLKTQMEIVKRGKVLYLFNRYIDDYQVQTLLLLQRGANIEIRGQMKSYLNRWGRSRYGDAWPARVQDDPPALFIGMTGIDAQFENIPPAKEFYNSRLDELARTLENVLKDFGGKPFSNIYPLRYPGTWDKDASKRQLLGVQRWVQAGEAFLAAELVQQHLGAHAQRRWLAAMEDTDGGFSLISEGFRKVTSAVKKQDALRVEIAQTRARLLQLIKSWAVDPDVNLDREKRLDLAKRVLDWLTEDTGLVYHRVHALQTALCFERGDVIPVADFADMRPAGMRLVSDPLERRLPQHLQAFLDEWVRDLAAQRWAEHTQTHAEGAPWLSADDFFAFAAYLKDYLCAPQTQTTLLDRLLQVVTLRITDESARRQARRKYARLILNDYVMNPGADGATLGQTYQLPEGEYGLMESFVRRWATRLPEALALGAREEVRIPPGNAELIGIQQAYENE